ncbi:MarR family winged helix-turn-helix transcriptional regulator [Gordonia sputi]|uniref:MarR family winged helix-turn-helix transcriptional regulator n=1 Tax=Gordonia sputi TaxID=36823 RepID=UPI0003110242|nr:MarR family winged helix-turn-helix transcriptional regulator [Gordonia sputi]NKY96019.1 winged helix-turn-helix transcriptional regulator [Gordonia sputi]
MSASLLPESSPGLLLWRVTLQWQRRITAVLKPLGLTHVQFVLLTSVWWLTSEGGEQPSQRRVAEFAGTDVMMTSQVLRTLEEKHLVERHTDPNDGRSKILTVTSAGSDLAKRAVQEVEATDAAFFSPTDTAAVLALLHQLDRP